MINSNSVLSPAENTMVVITAIIIHVLFAIFLIYISDDEIPERKPAGIRLVSFGNIITPTETPLPSQTEFTPSVTEAEQIEDTTPQEQNPDIQTIQNEKKISVPEKKEEEKQEPKKEEKKIEPKKEEKKENKTEQISNEEAQVDTKDKQGNSDNIKNTGEVGTKDGTKAKIPGWRWVNEPKPNNAFGEQGTVKVAVTIDKNGNVIGVEKLEISEGIGISTYASCKESLLKTKFKRTVSEPATEPTVGELTFYLKL